MRNIFLCASKKIIDTKDVVSLRKKSFTQVGAKKAGSAGNEYFLHILRPPGGNGESGPERDVYCANGRLNPF